MSQLYKRNKSQRFEERCMSEISTFLGETISPVGLQLQSISSGLENLCTSVSVLV
jgi:hypothetical protein